MAGKDYRPSGSSPGQAPLPLLCRTAAFRLFSGASCERLQSYARAVRIEPALDHYRELLDEYEFLTRHRLYEGRRTPEEAVATLARFCPCGVYNPERARRLLEEARSSQA